MNNMPSVMKEMPIAAAGPVTGKWTQPERLLPVAGSGRDFPASAANSDSPETFQRLLHKNLQGQDQGSGHEASFGGDRQAEDQDSIKTQMARTGTKAELPATAGEETFDRERLTSAPEIRGTAKKKSSKAQNSVGANHFILSSGNIAPVTESSDHSPAVTVGGRRWPHRHRDGGGELKIAAATPEEVLSVPSALRAATADAAPMVAGSDAAEILPSRGGRRDASGKAEGPVRFSAGHVDGQAASAKRRAGIGGSLATDGAVASGNSAPPEDLGDSMRTTRNGKSRQGSEGRGADAGAAPLFKTNFGKRAQGMATTEKMSASPTSLGAQGADVVPGALEPDAEEKLFSLSAREGASGKVEEWVHLNDRQLDGQAVFAETGSGPGGSKGTAVGKSHAALKTNLDGRVHQPLTGEKMSPPLRDPGSHAPDAVTGESGSDDAEILLSRGVRQDISGKTEGPVFFNYRHIGKEAAPAKRGADPGGRAAAVETGALGDSARAGRGGESGQDSGSTWTASGIVPSPRMTNPAERVLPLMTGDKMAPLPSAFASAVAGTAQIASGGDPGSVISSAGQEAVLMTQVVEAAQPLMQHGGGRVLISLNPPSLGALDIDVRVKRDTVELFVIANNQDVQQTLCSHVEQLRKALVDQGLNMDRFQVVVGDRSGGQQGRDPRQEGMSGWQGQSQGDRGYHPETDGENASDGMRKPVRSDAYPSIGGINLFI